MPKFDPIIEKITDYVQSFEAKENSLLEAKTCFFDSLACSFLALEYDQVQKFCSIEYIKNSKGSSRVIGTYIKSNPVEAAFLNGALIRWLDFNDTWLAKEWGHPSDNLAAILSMHDYLKVERNKNYSFKDLLNLMVIAHEVQGCLAIENSLNEVGIDHVAFVKVASAAIASKMLGQGSQKMNSTISNSFIDGQSLRTYRHFPNTGTRKSWAAGDASARGIKQAFISEVSEEIYPSALSVKTWGFNDVIMKKDSLKLLRELDSYVMDNILYKVNFPAEFHAQTAAEAAINLKKSNKFKIEDIDQVEILTQEPGVRIISKKGPLKNYADRDHCIEYIVAWCLINGSLNSDSYSDASSKDPQIESLRNCTVTKEDKNYTKNYYDLNDRAIGNKVSIKLKNGIVFHEEVKYPLGHKQRREESKPFLKEKFKSAMEKFGIDTEYLMKVYESNNLDDVDISNILDKIYK